MLLSFMSHSVFKEQKSFNLQADFQAGFSVEAADNIPDLLVLSTAFLKKRF
jgi:hypothetical protein